MIALVEYTFEVTYGKTTFKDVASLPKDTSTAKAVSHMLKGGYTTARLIDKSWPKYAWPGGYEMFYVCQDGGVLCHQCANEHKELTMDVNANADWNIVGASNDSESECVCCDHCGRVIVGSTAEELPM